MAGLGSLIQKAKAMIPKVVSAGKQVVNNVVNKVADSAFGKAVKAVPQTLKAGVEKGVQITKKVAASVPQAIESVKKKAEETAGRVQIKVEEVKGKVQAKAEEVKESVTKKIQEVTSDMNQRNGRILDKVKAEWENTSSGLIRGFTTTGAISPQIWQVRSSSLLLDFMLQTRKAVIEEYPILNRQSSILKDLIHTIETGISDGGAIAGSFIYNMNLPGISDFVGAFTGQREPGAKSNSFSIRGAFYRGLLVDGLLGTVDGVANLIADPFEALEGLNTIVLYPKETLPAIGSGIKEYVNTKIIHGSPEDWAQVTGQVTFEVASWLVGTGEAKAGIEGARLGTGVAKTGDMVADGSKMTKALWKAMDKMSDSGKTVKYLNTQMLKRFGKEALKNLDDFAVIAGKRTGDFIDNIRAGMSRLTGPIPEYAGIGTFDDIGRTGEKIEDFISACKKKFIMSEKTPKSGVNIKPKVDKEDFGKLIDDLPGKNGAKGSVGSNTRLIPGTEGVVTGGDSTKLGKNMMESMGQKRSTKWTGHQAQHIIPSEMKDHQVLQKIGMDFDDASNGLFLRTPAEDVSAMSRHRGYHSTYNEFVKSQLDAIDITQDVNALQRQVLDLQSNLKKLQQSGLPLYPNQGASVDLWQRSLNRIK